MEKHIVSTESAPAAIGPYSQAVVGNRTLYVSGQLPIDPSTGEMPCSIEEQIVQSMKNVLSIISAAGGTAENIVKCTLFIRDMTAFTTINEKYATFFKNDAPARAVVEVSALPKGAKIEIEAIAAL